MTASQARSRINDLITSLIEIRDTIDDNDTYEFDIESDIVAAESAVETITEYLEENLS